MTGAHSSFKCVGSEKAFHTESFGHPLTFVPSRQQPVKSWYVKQVVTTIIGICELRLFPLQLPCGVAARAWPSVPKSKSGSARTIARCVRPFSSRQAQHVPADAQVTDVVIIDEVPAFAGRQYFEWQAVQVSVGR